MIKKESQDLSLLNLDEANPMGIIGTCVGFDILIWLIKSDLDYDDADDNHKTIITTIQGIMTS